MKVCQLCAVDFTMARFLLPLMRGIADAGHEVVGVCADGPELDLVRAAGFRVIPLPLSRSLSPPRIWRAIREVRRVLVKERFDLLHVHTPVAAAVARFAALGIGVPTIVYTAHGFYFHDRMAPLKRSAFIAIEWLAGRLTDTLFTQSSEDADSARRLRLCRTGDVLAIGNGSDPKRFSPDPTVRARIRAKFGVAPDRVVIASVGRLVAEKGFPELIEALRSVDADLWIIGDRLPSDHAETIDSVLDKARTDPVLMRRVKLLGRREDVPDLLRAADIFCLASHREGMPRSVIEAMLSGLPIVATDIRGCREEVENGVNGILVPVNDQVSLAQTLGELCSAPDRRACYGRASRERAQASFDEAQVVARQLQHLGLQDPANNTFDTARQLSA